MKKLLLLIAIQIAFAAAVHAQHAVSSATWQILNTYTVVAQKDKLVTFYPPPLKALDNKVIDLPGYIVPIKVGKDQKEFMLSVLPVEQCAFCGSGDYPPMVLVKLTKAVAYATSLVFVKGKLVLNYANDNQPEYTLIDASLTK